jgi:hypothetical protein
MEEENENVNPEMQPISDMGLKLTSLLENIHGTLQPTKLQTRTNMASIIGTILSFVAIVITIVFAVQTNKLTKKYGENTSQLDTLTEMVKNQRIQNNRLISMAGALEKQNDLTSQQITKLSNILADAEAQYLLSKGSNRTGRIQARVIQDQLKLLKTQENKFNVDDSLENVANTISIIKTFDKMLEPDLFFKASMQGSLIPKERLKIVRKVKALLEEQIANKFFLKNDDLRTVWFTFYNYTAVYEERLALVEIGSKFTQQEEILFGVMTNNFSSFFSNFTNVMRKYRISYFAKILNSLPQKVIFK